MYPCVNDIYSKDYLKYPNAQSFLHFGTDPKGSDSRVAGTIYHQTIDGKDAIRVIYMNEIGENYKIGTVFIPSDHSDEAMASYSNWREATGKAMRLRPI